jgi:LPXTG-motif cell wall-anchored protein
VPRFARLRGGRCAPQPDASPTTTSNTKTKDPKHEIDRKRPDEAKSQPVSKFDTADKEFKTPGKDGKPDAPKAAIEADTGEDRKEPVKGNKAPEVSQAPGLPNGKVPGNPDKPGPTPADPDNNKAMTQVIVPEAPKVVTGYGPALVGEQSSFVGNSPNTEVIVPATALTPATVSVSATSLTPATFSVPATALTPATVSIPVEVPATATTPSRTESVAKPSRSTARTEAKTVAANDTADQLAHTGAEETAALAALALALMGTGITLVGLNRRRQAA